MYVCMYIYIYIARERKRERDKRCTHQLTYTNTYVCIYIHTYILLYTDALQKYGYDDVDKAIQIISKGEFVRQAFYFLFFILVS